MYFIILMGDIDPLISTLNVNTSNLVRFCCVKCVGVFFLSLFFFLWTTFFYHNKCNAKMCRICTFLTTTYFSEFDLPLVDHSGRGRVASAVHKPASVSDQHYIRLLHRLRQTAGQCVPHLELQGTSIGVNLKTVEIDVMLKLDNQESIIKSGENLYSLPCCPGTAEAASRKSQG